MYPLLTGVRSEQAFPGANQAYIFLVVCVVFTLLIVLYRRMMRAVPPDSYIGRAAKAFGLMVLAVCLLNVAVQGGLGIPLAVAYAGLLVAFWWEAQQLEWTGTVVAAVVWLGIGFLIGSGMLLVLAHSSARFDLQRLHGIYGYLWMPAVGAYLIKHIAHYEAKRETAARNWGYLAAAMLSAAALTGVARLHGGGETWASGLWPHVLTGGAAASAIAVHVARSWKKSGRKIRLTQRSHSAFFILGCLGIGVVLPAVPFAQHAIKGRTPAGAAACDNDQLATSDRQITASGPHHACLPVALVSIRQSAISCGKNGGCHVDVQAQWEHSAHRFSANAAYQRTVRL